MLEILVITLFILFELHASEYNNSGGIHPKVSNGTLLCESFLKINHSADVDLPIDHCIYQTQSALSSWFYCQWRWWLVEYHDG